jgi:hypothetical protein
MIDERSRILEDKITAQSYGPGYRDFSFEVVNAKGKKCRVDLSIEDSLSLAHEILAMHDLAWSGEKPIDAKPNEIKPEWIMSYPDRPYYGRLFEKKG